MTGIVQKMNATTRCGRQGPTPRGRSVGRCISCADHRGPCNFVDQPDTGETGPEMAARLAQYEQEILEGAAHRAAVIALEKEVTPVDESLAQALDAYGPDSIKRAHVLRAWHTGRPFDPVSSIAEGRGLLFAHGLDPLGTPVRSSRNAA